MLRSLPLFLVLLLSACDLMPERLEDTTNWSASKFYTEANDKLTSGDYEGAIKMFESLEAQFPYGRYAQQSQLETIYAHYKDQEPASAIAAANRFIKLYPNHVNVDYAYYLKGLANFNDNLGLISSYAQNIIKMDMSERDSKASRESFESFKELITRFPNSKYRADAIQRMAHLVTVVAKSEVHVARYYMKRKAHVAAANRALYAVTKYPRTPSTEEALSIMIQAYEALEMYDLRDDAERILKKNFPDSVYLSDTPEMSEIDGKSWWKLW